MRLPATVWSTGLSSFFCVVGIKGHVFVYRVFNSIVSPKLRTFNVCISFLRCWNQGPMVFVYRIFNSYHLSYVLWLFAYLFCLVGIKGGWFLFTEYLTEVVWWDLHICGTKFSHVPDWVPGTFPSSYWGWGTISVTSEVKIEVSTVVLVRKTTPK